MPWDLKKLSFEHHLFVRYPPPVTDDFLHCLLIFPCSSPQSKPAMWGAWMVEAAMTNLASARKVIPEHTVDSVSTCNTCGTPYTYWCIVCSSDFYGLAIFSSPLESQLALIRRHVTFVLHGQAGRIDANGLCNHPSGSTQLHIQTSVWHLKDPTVNISHQCWP